MSDILNELLSKVSALTTTVNQIIASSKSVPELPTQETLDATSLLPVSRDGVSEKITVQQIVNAAVNNDNDQLITIGEITLDGNDLTIDSISGKINNVIQFISTPTVINIPFCGTGLNRIDLIVYDNANNIVRIPGTETAGSIIIAPIQPLETLLITPISVSDTVIGEPEAPIVGASYIKKSFDKIHQFTAAGTDVVIPFHLYGYSTIELSGALTSVSGFSFTDLIANPAVAEYPHDGKSMFIINRSGHDITFKNADFASLAVVFFAFDGGNIVIPNNGKLELKYTEDGLIDVLKSWVDLSGKLDKVSTVDVEKVYIKNADGTQSMKPTSELGGGDDYIITTTQRVFIDFPNVNEWLCSNAGYANSQFLGGTLISCGSGTTPSSSLGLYAVILPIPVGYIVDQILVNLNYKAYNTTNSTLEFFVQREETAGTGQVNTGSNPFTISNDTLVTTTGSTSNLRRIESLAINTHSLPSLAFSYLQIAIRETQNASYNAISLQIKFKKV